MIKKQTTKDDYLKRVQKVTDYIHKHLDEDLSFETLANIACLSPYHWHRIYRSVTGETITETVRRLRLQRAAKDLVETSKAISKIAIQAGYTNTDSFTRKFHTAFDTTPQIYRDNGRYIVQQIRKFQKNNTKGLKEMYQVKIYDQMPLRLAALDHKGNYMEISRVFEKLMTTCSHKGILTSSTSSFGLYYDDPNVIPEAELRSKAAITLPSKMSCPSDLQGITIPGGSYAQIIHKGAYNELETAYNWLYKVWLLESGYEPAEPPVIEEYLNDPRETAPSELLTIINIPLKG